MSALEIAVIVPGLANDTRLEPTTEMAFSFLDPMTAPKPPWPQAEELAV